VVFECSRAHRSDPIVSRIGHVAAILRDRLLSFILPMVRMHETCAGKAFRSLSIIPAEPDSSARRSLSGAPMHFSLDFLREEPYI
jgi:hypothetical protein